MQALKMTSLGNQKKNAANHNMDVVLTDKQKSDKTVQAKFDAISTKAGATDAMDGGGKHFELAVYKMETDITASTLPTAFKNKVALPNETQMNSYRVFKSLDKGVDQVLAYKFRHRFYEAFVKVLKISLFNLEFGSAVFGTGWKKMKERIEDLSKDASVCGPQNSAIIKLMFDQSYYASFDAALADEIGLAFAAVKASHTKDDLKTLVYLHRTCAIQMKYESQEQFDATLVPFLSPKSSFIGGTAVCFQKYKNVLTPADSDDYNNLVSNEDIFANYEHPVQPGQGLTNRKMIHTSVNGKKYWGVAMTATIPLVIPVCTYIFYFVDLLEGTTGEFKTDDEDFLKALYMLALVAVKVQIYYVKTQTKAEATDISGRMLGMISWARGKSEAVRSACTAVMGNTQVYASCISLLTWEKSGSTDVQELVGDVDDYAFSVSRLLGREFGKITYEDEFFTTVNNGDRLNKFEKIKDVDGYADFKADQKNSAPERIAQEDANKKVKDMAKMVEELNAQMAVLILK